MQSQRRDGSLDGAINALRRIIQAIRLSSSVVQDTLGVTGAQLFVLQQLAEAPGASLRELADRTLTDQSSVSVVVSRVVASGFAARRTSPSDARRTELTLTDRGRELLGRAPELAQTRLVAALRAVPAPRLRVAADVLDGVARALSSTDQPAAMFFEPAHDRRRPARAKRATAKRAKRSPAVRGRGQPR